MEAQKPLVSVIAVCFNHSRFLAECLDSIRNQTYKNVQLLIIDDCSTDSSVLTIRDWISRTKMDCTFLVHKENMGVCSTLNEALSYANGKYVAMIATDDIWMPEKLARQVAHLESLSESAGVLYSDAYQINEDGDQLPRLFIESHRHFAVAPEGNILPALLEGNFIPAMTTLIRRTALETVGPYDERLAYEDFDMWLRLSHRFMFAFSPYISAKYRIVSTSLTSTVLRPGKPSRFVSDFIIYSKCLRRYRLDETTRKKVIDKLTQVAHRLRKRGYPNAPKYLWTAFRYNLRLTTLGMLILSLFGIPYGSFSRRVRKAKSYLSWRLSFLRGKNN